VLHTTERRREVVNSVRASFLFFKPKYPSNKTGQTS
jgi:hypothetical protein